MPYDQHATRSTHWDIPSLKLLRLRDAVEGLEEQGVRRTATPERADADPTPADQPIARLRDPKACTAYHHLWDDLHRTLYAISTGAQPALAPIERDLFRARAEAVCPTPESARLATRLLDSVNESVGDCPLKPHEVIAIKKNLCAMKELWNLDRAHLLRMVTEVYEDGA